MEDSAIVPSGRVHKHRQQWWFTPLLIGPPRFKTGRSWLGLIIIERCRVIGHHTASRMTTPRASRTI